MESVNGRDGVMRFLIVIICEVALLGGKCIDDGMPAPTGCGDVDSSLATLDAQTLFDGPGVPVFDLYLPRSQWEALKKNARDQEYVPANACFQGRSIGEVGLRFKGNADHLR